MKRFLLVFAASLAIMAGKAQTVELEIKASMDNSIYQEEELSNGAGDYLFTGVTKNNQKRRALVKFDLADTVPAGITLDSARLILTPSKVKTGGTTVKVHRVETEWGEGTSDADNAEGQGATATTGDATWTKAVTGGDSWIKAGGDYVQESSAEAIVSLENEAEFTSASLAADVNSWLSAPASNHGWILIGDESATSTAIRFNSRENPELNTRPRLIVYYQESTSIPRKDPRSSLLQVFVDQQSREMVIRSAQTSRESSIGLYSISGALIHSSRQVLLEGETRIPLPSGHPGVIVYRIVSEKQVSSGILLVGGQ